MNKITSLFKIKYPIIQAGMVWASGWRLASSVSNAGGLGIIGAGSMHPDILKMHIEKCIQATSRPFGVNVPLIYPEMKEVIDILIQKKVQIVFTSAGNPNIWTSKLKSSGCKVVHVVSSVKFAKKAEEAGVDAIVAEGFEAGGHNGREETTTMVLIPLIKKSIKLPLIAAGGIATGSSMAAAICLGADAVQIGSRFVTSNEASSHINFKKAVLKAKQGSTILTLKEITPVRMMKNKFYDEIVDLYKKGSTPEELSKHLGKGRAKKGMFEGDLEEGELEIGQVASQIDKIIPSSDIIREIIQEFNSQIKNLSSIKL
ncbi:MAG: nitronate monooxygenase [Flavobacteriaceae bacterium]|nr:nitronate monooxygenase [Flavobacteriaceae bacterium]|tara:strand:+ start:3716 stop:4660 length:945 start_codon:yes stop_codon:yes gene_type:complete